MRSVGVTNFLNSQRRRNYSAVWNKIKKYKLLYLFMIPGIISLFIFNYGAMFGLMMVFQEYNPAAGFLQSPWCGLENFRTLFSSANFASALRNTLVISSIKIVVITPLPILFALLLNELRALRFKKIIQTVTYLPHFVSWVIVSGIWYKMLSPDDGLINQLLMAIGVIGEPIYFMQDKVWFYIIIVFTDIWKCVAYGSIYYVAGISSIDLEQYEAAMIDGAGRLKQALYVTLPSLKPTIVLMVIFNIAGLLDAGFDQLWTMGNLAVRDVAEIIDTSVVRSLTSGSIQDLSISAAMGFFKSVIGLILFILANLFSKKLTNESII